MVSTSAADVDHLMCLFQPSEEYQLPIPVVHVEHLKDGGDMVKWELSARPDMVYKLTSFAVNVIGERFTTEINSNIRWTVYTSPGQSNCRSDITM